VFTELSPFLHWSCFERYRQKFDSYIWKLSQGCSASKKHAALKLLKLMIYEEVSDEVEQGGLVESTDGLSILRSITSMSMIQTIIHTDDNDEATMRDDVSGGGGGGGQEVPSVETIYEKFIRVFKSLIENEVKSVIGDSNQVQVLTITSSSTSSACDSRLMAELISLVVLGKKYNSELQLHNEVELFPHLSWLGCFDVLASFDMSQTTQPSSALYLEAISKTKVLQFLFLMAKHKLMPPPPWLASYIWTFLYECLHIDEVLMENAPLILKVFKVQHTKLSFNRCLYTCHLVPYAKKNFLSFQYIFDI
jgi:hypothetical protein